ncbi:hypothetical protein H0H93_006341 [Arthromyces matolae]|nr:hypothetical protein H0H93_006341 [Arthromyces matolae]
MRGLLITAESLGNPSHWQPLDSDADFRNQQHGIDVAKVRFDARDSEPPRYGSIVYTVNRDKNLYDIESIVDVSFNWNDEVETCFENKAIITTGYVDRVLFREQILSRINLLPTVGVRIKTLKDSTLSIETYEHSPHFFSIPSSITLPRIPISELRRRKGLEAKLDIVTLHDDYYAFKHVGTLPDDDDDFLLKELEFYVSSGFECNFLVIPTFVVTDLTGSLFRGFLTPFLPAGTLSTVFHNLHPDEPRDLPLFPQGPTSPDSNTSSHGSHDNTRLAWSIKRTWAIQVVTAVAAIHAVSFCGDIKLENVLLDRSGHCQLIDYAPVSGYSENYIPPEGILPGYDLSGPRDIFALGLVLWQIASEVGRFNRDFVRSPILVWRDSEDGPQAETPTQFRDLVMSCLVEEPEKRPSVADILSLLKNIH